VACEKLKKILSANPEAPMNVECLMEDTDFSSSMTRDKLEEMAVKALSRVEAPLSACLADSGLTVEEISSVELVGNASRIPAVVKTVESFFKKEVCRTLNSSESVARGCALQGAMLSPAFKVRLFPQSLFGSPPNQRAVCRREHLPHPAVSLQSTRARAALSHTITALPSRA
jgi:heat shock protein 4